MMIDLKPLLSPEWAQQEDYYVTTQLGASLSFITDGVKKIRLVFANQNSNITLAYSSNNIDWQDIVVDSTGQVNISVQDGRHDLVLRTWQKEQALFWASPLKLLSMSIDDGLVSPITESQPFLTFVGDSITVGEDMASDGDHPELSYPVLVSKALQKPLARIAYGGSGLTPFAPFQVPTAIESLWHVARNVPRPLVSTDLVVVNYGTNDLNYGASPQDFAFGLRVYLLEIIKRFHDAKIFILLPFNGAFETVFRNEMSRFEALTFINTNKWQIATDRVHPTVADHERIAKLILEELK
ncbi:MAG: SGNH/GDSL hydrolase family protein [Leuconostoc pseudomesenteroides]|uniref:SGNH/GDSL hydrolase family protein n=1 Tax=Leuconostoc pseudomesenteroides TaxID=33968 RepID=UPI0039ECBF92